MKKWGEWEDATFETSGIYHIIGDSIMELVTPSLGEKTYYRMLNNRQVMLSDKEGTISQSLLAEHINRAFVLTFHLFYLSNAVLVLLSVLFRE